jgi:hypothetical protein
MKIANIIKAYQINRKRALAIIFYKSAKLSLRKMATVKLRLRIKAQSRLYQNL